MAFCKAIYKFWGAIVTGGFFIGALTIWQGSGHGVSPWLYIGIALAAIVVSSFRAWDEEVNRAERAEHRVAELVGRPDVSLEVTAARRGEALARTLGRDTIVFDFIAKNGGPGQILNVSIADIVLPMSEHSKLSTLDVEQLYKDHGGELGTRKPGWDQWVVEFERVSSVADGDTASIPFRIKNMPFNVRT